MREFFNRASNTSYQVGLVLCLIHLIIAWWVIIKLSRSEPDAQWQLVWIFFLPFDLPFSLLVFFSGSIFPDWSFKLLPYPMGEFRSFILPTFVHGIIGPLWYFFLPVCFSSLRAYRGIGVGP
ncbi:MAG: hypothetical protein C4B58_14495 [Deltaproteobacteria bacterium]|nr:MAG: hypothetical protein C4B58_14495 [Deltaproteobacteria bacterium]